MRGATEVTLQHHQMLHLPRKMTLTIDPRHIWNVIYNARSNRCHPPTSPNTAPATKNDFHEWSSSHMKRYLPCAEQQVSSSNITEYCACHAKWPSKIWQKFLQNKWNVIYNAGPIREWSDHDPRMIRPWSEHETGSPQPASRKRGYFSCSPRAFCIEKYNISRSGYHSKFHHQMLHLPRIVTLGLRAPATKNHSDDWSASHMKRYLQCAEQHHPPTSPNTAPATQTDPLKFHRNFSQTDDTSFTMRDRSGHDPTMIRIRPQNRQSATRLASEVTFRARHEHFVLKNTTFRTPAIIPNFTKCCTCHEKWHLTSPNICACHEK